MRRISLFYTSISYYESIKLILYSFLVLFLKPGNQLKHKKRFERYWTENIGGIASLCTPTARAGLYVLLKSWNIKDGDEVLVTGFTCSAVPEPIILNGAKPVYVDIDKSTFCMDLAKIKKAINAKTKCIIVQHTFGISAEVNRICQIAESNNIKVIEDCALALGSKKDKKFLGSQGDASYWSFELSKTISVGWGGLIQLNKDKNLEKKIRDEIESADKLSRLVKCQKLFQGGVSGLLYRPRVGIFRYFLPLFFKLQLFKKSSQTPADNLSMPDDRQWKILLEQLKRLDQLVFNNKKIINEYKRIFKKINYNQNDKFINNNEFCMLRLPVYVENPEKCLKLFYLEGVEIGTWFKKPVSSGNLDEDSYYYNDGDCMVAERACKKIINLPVSPRMKIKDLSKIENIINSISLNKSL